MAWIRIQEFKGKVYVPEDAPCRKKHPCKDCFSCQHCADERCALCRNSPKKDDDTSEPDTTP